ncbi:hypothetical protein LXD45_004302 [Escherichia coli]|uniref:hypothetical protein n=1 Tax=Enterobacteriaceae TaxID=543 RepID=UPI000775106A|nr:MULTISPECIES: hypothetical protein [Enterobacteriaceae]EHS3482764.1 hypothetical protein [Escherichia coli]EHS3486939.1 hypothetical protein [Escherichia coli]EHS3505423.1 hypothetical protein [Escherichia coli]EHS3514172.1 hypothetical protein [Escherichia coli]EHS3518356.1 hypothetical protein [Escherichia coli]
MKATHYRYLITFMVLIIMIINYIDRGALAYAQEEIITEYNLTATQWGSILGFLDMDIYSEGYLVESLLTGEVPDLSGVRL